MTDLHVHDWEIRLDSNCRRYASCWKCPIIVHEWEAGFHSIYIKAPSFARENPSRWETKRP